MKKGAAKDAGSIKIALHPPFQILIYHLQQVASYSPIQAGYFVASHNNTA
jgi:hypothetical protein